ncbi:MAG: VOC family protein [Spirochaetaceae bacterium]|jgi:catechol 2,3-dioxygenase-like lactoylglutathione lyase family enzyme|nr:VOC family protein [Spirochaetaceae bacterium]
MDKPILGNNIVVQIGILCHDIEQTKKDWAEFLGVEVPPTGMTGEAKDAKTEYLGKPSAARTKQAFFSVGPNVDIELLEPDKDMNSTWRQDLEKQGEGFHHIAFNVKSMKDGIEASEKMGYKLLQRGQWDTGCYAYLDAKKQLKLVLELLEHWE